MEAWVLVGYFILFYLFCPAWHSKTCRVISTQIWVKMDNPQFLIKNLKKYS